MNSTNYDEPSEKQLISAPVLIIGGIAAALLLPRLFGRKRSLPSKPPPIIVKSGSFVIESDIALQPQPAGYKRPHFGSIKGLRVIWYNEIIKNDVDDDYFAEDEQDWGRGDDVEVSIGLLYCTPHPSTGDCETWRPGPNAVIRSSGNELLLDTTVKLSGSKGKKHRRRKAVREDDQPEIIRFGAIKIYNKTRGREIKSYPQTSGREYLIGVYDAASVSR